MKTINKHCLNCNIQFKAELKEHKRGYGKFCCRTCSAQYNAKKRYSEQTKPNVTCAYCNILFYKNASQQKNSKSGLFFCCREHKDLAQRIDGLSEIQPDHYGNGGYSYRGLAFRLLPNLCDECGFDEFPDVLHVHHIDHDRTNNDISNLRILCPTCHEVEHFLQRSGRWCSKRKFKDSNPE